VSQLTLVFCGTGVQFVSRKAAKENKGAAPYLGLDYEYAYAALNGFAKSLLILAALRETNCSTAEFKTRFDLQTQQPAQPTA
jgi:hypothetical protein